MSFEFDHFFTFVNPSFVTTDHDLPISGQVEHKGQGTSAQFCLFSRFYFEWIWISNESDSKKNPLQLNRRSQWRDTGWCPFGIGARGRLSDSDKVDYWLYNPPYAPLKNIWVHKACSEVPNLPMFFIQEMDEKDKYENWWPEKRVKNSSKRIVSEGNELDLKIYGPELAETPFEVESVSFTSKNQFIANARVRGFSCSDSAIEHFKFIE